MSPQSQRAVILAAGRSTRIQARVGNRPKPLISLGGRTLLEWNLQSVARAGVQEVWINLHYQPDLIEELIGDGARFGLHVHYLLEEELLGTAGALSHLAADLAGGPFLIVYGDNLTALDMNALIGFHQEKAAQMTVAVFDPESVPNTGIAGGRVVMADDGRIEVFEEHPDGVGKFVNAGVYVAEPEMLTFIPSDLPSDFGRDVFPLMLEQGARLFGFPMTGYCLAVDTPEALDRAEALVEELILVPL